MRASSWISWALLLSGFGCAAGPADPHRYRLSLESESWRRAGDDAVLADLEGRYPEFFRVVLDPTRSQDLDIRRVRNDLESRGSGRRRFDGLNAVAIAYFELNSRAQRGLEDDSGGAHYLADSFRATKLLSIPWRAYGEIQDPLLREAILDFFEDVAHGRKRDGKTTATRITRTVASLEKKESDPGRRERIARLTAYLRAQQADR